MTVIYNNGFVAEGLVRRRKLQGQVDVTFKVNEALKMLNDQTSLEVINAVLETHNEDHPVKLVYGPNGVTAEKGLISFTGLFKDDVPIQGKLLYDNNSFYHGEVNAAFQPHGMGVWYYSQVGKFGYFENGEVKIGVERDVTVGTVTTVLDVDMSISAGLVGAIKAPTSKVNINYVGQHSHLLLISNNYLALTPTIPPFVPISSILAVPKVAVAAVPEVAIATAATPKVVADVPEVVIATAVPKAVDTPKVAIATAVPKANVAPKAIDPMTAASKIDNFFIEEMIKGMMKDLDETVENNFTNLTKFQITIHIRESGYVIGYPDSVDITLRHRVAHQEVFALIHSVDGQYEGTVDEHCCPHGVGTFYLFNKRYQVRGMFVHGILVEEM